MISLFKLLHIKFKNRRIIMEETKTFKINMISGEYDFTQIVNWIKEKRYRRDEIERTLVIFYDTGSVEVVIRRVNPPRPPLAKIKIVGYIKKGYGGYGGWDVRGIIQMISEKIIEKV
jgi:hypothetical protein